MPRNFHGTYVRHSVDRDVLEFEGWEALLARYDRIKREVDYELAQVYAAAFLTGGRIGETLGLTADMFTQKTEQVQLVDNRVIERPVLEVKGMPLEKRYTKKSHYTMKVRELPANNTRRLFETTPDSEGFYTRKRFVTEKVYARRKPFDVPIDEVPSKWRTMHDDLVFWLRANKGQPHLFPSRTKLTSMSPSFVWKVFKPYGIYPHYLRAQRASCLTTWNGLRQEQMMEWMSWENWETASRYAKMGKSALLGVFRRYEG